MGSDDHELLLCVVAELVTDIRVGNGNQLQGALLNAAAPEMGNAVFRTT